MSHLISHPSFQQLAQSLFGTLTGDESLSLHLQAEHSRFLRFNQARVRQATQVLQMRLTLNLQAAGREAKMDCYLGSELGLNQETCLRALEQLRRNLKALAPDPYFVPHENHGQSSACHSAVLPSLTELSQLLQSQTLHVDLAGLYCEGPMIEAQLNSKGLDHWFENNSFFFDFSLYSGERAAKGFYAGHQWREEEFLAHLQSTKDQLQLLHLPLCAVSPGNYRCYLAPAAAYDFLGLLGWGGFSFGEYKRGQSCLGPLYDKTAQLSPKLSLEENFSKGLVPRFNSSGEIAPKRIALIEGGLGAELLVSSKTAKEYQAQANGASDYESFRSLKVLPGQLPSSEVLKALDRGLYLSQLHYLNYSDRPKGRITGMTRYACFWVDGGQIQGPIKDLRFDESLYRALGDNLIDLTQETELFPNTSTYDSRGFGLVETPGLLIDDFSFKA